MSAHRGPPRRPRALENTEPGLVRVYSESDDLLAEVAVVAGTVGRSTPVTVTLSQPVSVAADEVLYVVVTSEGSAGAGGLQAWLTDDVAAGSLVKAPAEAVAEATPSQLAADGEPQQVALAMRGSGLGSAALVAEGVCGGRVWSRACSSPLRCSGGPGSAGVRSPSGAGAQAVAATPRVCHLASRELADRDHLIRFDRKTLVVCGAVAVFFVVLVAAGVHYSSVEMWSKLLPPTPPTGRRARWCGATRSVSGRTSGWPRRLSCCTRTPGRVDPATRAWRSTR